MRPPRPEDAPRVAELVNLHSPEPFDVLWVEREWTEPGFDLEADARIDGDAYAAVWDGRGGKAWIDLQGAPTPELLAWVEARAREKGLVRALGGAWTSNAAVKELLEGAGYDVVRYHYRMRISLGDAGEDPSWPEGVTVRPFRPGDERVFYDVHQETFEDHWEHDEPDPYDEWAHWMLQPPIFEPELWFVAEEGDEPAGIAICHKRPEISGLGWVGILGVRRAWRRRGLGMALLMLAFQEFRARGFGEAGLGVDAESITGATRLYERAGMHVSARSDTYEKAL
ncbi:MAG: GNAT family N-acetyltransferase [Gaiellaceae bacterium]